MDGVIFDVLRCSMHDGPGIRTTVFLKGCPLRCQWCHNPESQAFAPELALFEAKCAMCGACAATCPRGAHRLAGGRHALDRCACDRCGRCVSACPQGALKLFGQRASADDVVETARKDAAFYRASGGGLTVSGGEPLAQPEFLAALLSLSRRQGIHTCVETSGFAPGEVIDLVAPHVDLFLFDVKAPASTHRALTGVELAPIAMNLGRLLDAGAQVLLRCPIVPGLNDTDEHFRFLAGLLKQWPAVAGMEMLPYHDLGRGKAAAIGRRYELGPTVDGAQKLGWKQRMREAGLPEAVVESF